MNRRPDTRPADRGLDEVELLILAVLAVVGLVVFLPVLAVAVPLATSIESRGWRRWPALAAGLLLTALVVVGGGWDAYRHTLLSLWLHLRADQPSRPVELSALAPLGLAGGILGAPLLQAVVHHRNEREITRHYLELSAPGRVGRLLDRRESRPGHRHRFPRARPHCGSGFPRRHPGTARRVARRPGSDRQPAAGHPGLGSQRAGNRYVVHPDDIRRLHQGEAFIIHGGHALKLRVRAGGQPPG